MRREDIAWSHYNPHILVKLTSKLTGRRRKRTIGTLSLSNASLTGFAVRVAGVEGCCEGAGSSAIAGWTSREMI